jgi:hypothetical protein
MNVLALHYAFPVLPSRPKKKGSRTQPQPLEIDLVAGARFELATFGL